MIIEQDAFDGLVRAIFLIAVGVVVVTAVFTVTMSLAARRFGRRGSLILSSLVAICAQVVGVVAWRVKDADATIYDLMWGCGLAAIGFLAGRRVWARQPG
jgi:ABC-type sulfate transport system permease subunit